jgi:hypothetical protein
LIDAQRAIVDACVVCEGQGMIPTTTAIWAHACDGTEESCARNCPVSEPQESADACEYCGRPSDAIMALLKCYDEAQSGEQLEAAQPSKHGEQA